MTDTPLDVCCLLRALLVHDRGSVPAAWQWLGTPEKPPGGRCWGLRSAAPLPLYPTIDLSLWFLASESQMRTVVWKSTSAKPWIVISSLSLLNFGFDLGFLAHCVAMAGLKLQDPLPVSAMWASPVPDPLSHLNGWTLSLLVFFF